MARANYQVLDVDTSVASPNPRTVLATGTKWDSITVLQIPGGLTASIAFYIGGAQWPILQVGQTFVVRDKCDNPFLSDEGVTVVHTAAVGTLRLGVSMGTNPPEGV